MMKKYVVRLAAGIIVIGSAIGYYVWHQIGLKRSKPFSYDYATVFPDKRVNRIDITILPSDWQRLEAQLKLRFGEKGTGEMMPLGKPGEKGFPPPMTGNGFIPDSAHQDRHPPMGGPGPMMEPKANRERGVKECYIPCTIQFEGKQWKAVGFRVKGNSSLMHSWKGGIEKYPFRLKFNAFKDSVQSTKNQRFYGFNKLSFSNGIKDPTLMREKLAADLFREAGVPAAHAAYYRVYINRGKGSEYFGLYTALEVVEDALLNNYFGNNSGNCYKPDGPGATFAKDTFNPASFAKKNNKKAADWRDVQQLAQILNDTMRVTNPPMWQRKLEQVFDVTGFIKWLAVNSMIQNWDTYGAMFHNFYLYHQPSTGQLSWIPWDNNEALNSDGMMTASSLMHDQTDANWPLIRFLLDNEAYKSLYDNEIKLFVTRCFEASVMEKRIIETSQLIHNYVVGSEGEVKGFSFIGSDDEFEQGKQALIEHVKKRAQLSEEYLNDK